VKILYTIRYSIIAFGKVSLHFQLSNYSTCVCTLEEMIYMYNKIYLRYITRYTRQIFKSNDQVVANET